MHNYQKMCHRGVHGNICNSPKNNSFSLQMSEVIELLLIGAGISFHAPLGQKHRKTSGQTKRMTAGFRAGLEFKVGL